MKKLAGLFLIALFLIGCSSNTETSTIENDLDKIHEIDITKYFPPPVTRNQYRSPNDDVTDSTIVSIAKYIVGEENTSHRILEETTYVFGNSLTTITDYSISERQITADSEIILMNQYSWENDGWIYEILEVGETITVEAGKFDEVIVVRQTNESTGLIFYKYYAPNIGLIKAEKDSPKYGKGVMYELILTDYTAYNTNVISANTSSEEVEENPIKSLVSGKLPLKTNLVSSLNFNDFRDRVDSYTLETIGYLLMTRPDNFIESDIEIKMEFLDDVSVIVEKDSGLIKEIAITQEGISELSFEVARGLLMGLDEEITMEIADTILYPNEENTTFEIAGFEVGIALSEEKFNFLAVAK